MSETQVQIGRRILEASDTVAATANATTLAASSPKVWAAEYYRQIAPTLLPHLRGRSVAFVARADNAPDPQGDVHRLADDQQELFEYRVIYDQAALQYAGILGAELHILLGRGNDNTQPAALMLGLEAVPPAGMVECAGIALDLRDMLAEVGLRCWVKTCGGRGLHLYVPLNTPATFAQTRTFARLVAETYADRYPDLATTNARKRVYAGQVFLDWRLNQEDQPSLCVYSLCRNGSRSGCQPAISTPVTWREVEMAWVRQDGSTLILGPNQVVGRVAVKGDLFAQVLTLQQHLPI